MNYVWKAKYDDGEEFNQFDESGNENRYEDIKRGNLDSFELWDKETGKKIYWIDLIGDRKLIFRRRNLINVTGGEESSRGMVYLVGWHMLVLTNGGPKKIEVLNYIFEDGSIGLSDFRNNLELIPEELG